MIISDETLARHSGFEVGWRSLFQAWLSSENLMGCARSRYGTRGMYYKILLRQYDLNYYTYNSVLKSIYNRCHKDAYVQVSIGNTEWSLRYKGVN